MLECMYKCRERRCYWTEHASLARLDASLLARGQVDNSRHAAMRGPFVQLQLLFDNRQVVKSAERLLQHGTRVEILDLLRPAGAVLQLLGRVALDDQEPARLERLAHAAPLQRSLRRRAELREDLDHNIERRLWVVEGMHVGLREGDRHTALPRERSRFALG